MNCASLQTLWEGIVFFMLAMPEGTMAGIVLAQQPGDPKHQGNFQESTGWGTTIPHFCRVQTSPVIPFPDLSPSLGSTQFQSPLLAPSGYPSLMSLCLCGAFPFTCPEFRNPTTLPATQTLGLGEAAVSLPCFPSKGLFGSMQL